MVDDVGVVNLQRVDRAALAVQNHAADVRVRVYRSVPAGDLDARIQAEQQTCASWRDPDGTRRDNLVELAVSVEDRRVGLYYGGTWAGELDDTWTGIQSQSMSPAFKQGQWTRGMVQGLRAAGREIDPLHGRVDDEYVDEGIDVVGPGSYDGDPGGDGFPGWLVPLVILGAFITFFARLAKGYDAGSKYWDEAEDQPLTARRTGFAAGTFLGMMGGRSHGSSHSSASSSSSFGSDSSRGSSSGSSSGSSGGGSDGGGSSSF